MHYGTLRGLAFVLLALATYGTSGVALGAGMPWSGMDSFISDEPPSDFFPGKYFELKGQFYLRKKDYATALRMFEQSGFWADKIAQYNVGIMYFNGIGIAVDRPRGVAWLRIAAEAHDDLAVHVLQLASAALSPDELAAAERLRPELEAKYSDPVAVSRALKHYSLARASITGSHLGFAGKLSITEAGPTGAQPQEGTLFYAALDKKRDALLNRITGHVTVGQVRALPVDPAAAVNAAPAPVNPPPGMP